VGASLEICPANPEDMLQQVRRLLQLGSEVEVPSEVADKASICLHSTCRRHAKVASQICPTAHFSQGVDFAADAMTPAIERARASGNTRVANEALRILKETSNDVISSRQAAN